MNFTIAVLPGDGVGPEVIAQGIKVLEAVGRSYGHSFATRYADIGGISIDKHGVALTEAALRECRESDAVFFGAVGGPKWDDPKAAVRPEDGLLQMRKGLGLFANLRPVKVLPLLENSSTVKPEIVRGVDLVVVRELTGGLYFGKPKKQWQTSSGWKAVDTMTYSEKEIRRILEVGFQLARTRRKKLASVDKANVLQTSRLWRQIAVEMGKDNPDVELEHVLVDNCAMRLIQSPANFDVIVTENTFGDILTDEASMLAGSMGMLPSASLAGIPEAGKGRIFGLYEPIHGSAPKRAGQNMANPLAAVLCVPMMFRYSLGLTAEAEVVEKAVDAVLAGGYRTYDIMSEGKTKVGTSEMGDLVARQIISQ